MGQPGPAPHRAGPIDDRGELQPLQHRDHQRQRPDQVAARGRIEPGERTGQVVQGAGVLEPVPATEVCHNTMADLAVLAPEALDDVHVLVHTPALTHLLHPHIHFPNILEPSANPSGGSTTIKNPSFPQHQATPQQHDQPAPPPPPHQQRQRPTPTTAATEHSDLTPTVRNTGLAVAGAFRSGYWSTLRPRSGPKRAQRCRGQRTSALLPPHGVASSAGPRPAHQVRRRHAGAHP